MFVPESCKEWLREQVVQYRDGPVAMAELSLLEAAAFVQHLPAKPPSVVFDIGCGVGRASALLHWIYSGPKGTEYHLFDCGGRLSQNLVGGWMPGHPEWCNNFSATRRFLRANGVDLDRVHTWDITEVPRLRVTPPWIEAGANPDIVISLLAVGFHWPIEEWLERLLPLCRPETTLIFGVRHGKYGADTFSGLFAERWLVETGFKEDVLILSGKRQQAEG